ncbi:hypothetical protein SPRG_00671 [Saprolegnia parasitica CBS 223.65]|uniref:Uncharacterized protein n=1 Tax=Saprolegnia parasitica (strain CBS 223.65) TaxID=695850 RepID=A0A067CVS6_SAPPC|nr:hypothetical protein SPRG_00671 [Saprolegnia parasitica CBS 223.65]KDO34608.1 hypothetical protein SPRG_00671 [Saprolegnia parasitica CBS 223.65]|eukprot:XP_012194285.1 hypothetical protein SPRG_00671 [Saprolegnia parasitica CBS 223.65]
MTSIAKTTTTTPGPMKPCASIASKSTIVQPSATALKEFRKRWSILSESERMHCLRGTGVQFFATVAELVPCLACRSGAESLFLRATTTLPLLCGSLNPGGMNNTSIQLNDSGVVQFHTDQTFVLHPTYLVQADATLALFVSHETQNVIQTTASTHKGQKGNKLAKHNTTLKVKTTTFNYETTMKLHMHTNGTTSSSMMTTTTTTHHPSSLLPTAPLHPAMAASGAPPSHHPLGMFGPPPAGLDLGAMGHLGSLTLGLSSLSLGLGMNFAKSSKRCALHSAKLKSHPRPGTFTNLWEKMTPEYQNEITQIDSDQFLNDLECYLRRHRFCCRCKEKVLEAYDLLVGSGCSESDCEDCAGLHCYSDDKSSSNGSSSSHEEPTSVTSHDDASAFLFDEISFCRDTNQIIVPATLEYLLQLMDRADQEVVLDRHARTLAEAQDEVLTCLGLVVWDKLQMMWSKIQCEERSSELLLYCAIATIRHNFDMAVEALHGQEIMEQLLAEEEEDSRREERKKEKRKEKKKKKKAATKSAASDSATPIEVEQTPPKPKKPKKVVAPKAPTMARAESPSKMRLDADAERQLLSSMGWEHDPVDEANDDAESLIPEDDMLFWKRNKSDLVTQRMEQRQKLQEKFNALLQRSGSVV